MHLVNIRLVVRVNKEARGQRGLRGLRVDSGSNFFKEI